MKLGATALATAGSNVSKSFDSFPASLRTWKTLGYAIQKIGSLIGMKMVFYNDLNGMV